MAGDSLTILKGANGSLGIMVRQNSALSPVGGAALLWVAVEPSAAQSRTSADERAGRKAGRCSPRINQDGTTSDSIQPGAGVIEKQSVTKSIQRLGSVDRGNVSDREGARLDSLFTRDRIGTGPAGRATTFATATRLSAALLRAGFSAAIAMGMRVHAGIAGVCPPAATCAGAVASCAFNIFGFWRNAMRHRA